MILHEWEVNLWIGWSTSLFLSTAIFGGWFLLKSKTKKSKIISILGIAIGLSSCIIIDRVSPKETHIYYQFEDLKEIDSLQEKGWKLQNNYTNKKIIHLKKGE